jgi:hypothetical protein
MTNGPPPEKLRAEFEARIARLTDPQKELARFDFEHGWNDLFYYSRRILNYDFEQQPHRESCDFLSSGKLHKVFLAPRGSFKTSQMSQAYPSWRIVKDPNIRVLFDSVSLKNSEDNLKVVENHLEFNPKIRLLYGDYSGKKELWNNTEFTCSKRTNPSLKEPTGRASGQGKIQIGPHYDLIIADDEHDKDNCRSADQTAKVKQHLRLLFGLLDPGGEMVIGGHRWTYTDAFSMVLGDTDDPEELKFAERFKDSMLIRSAEYEDGRLYFPKVLTRERLSLQRDLLGRDLFNAQYNNEPIVAGDNSKFSTRYFKRFKEAPAGTRWNLTVDPGGEKKKSDNWVFLRGGIDYDAKKYFQKYVKKVCKLTEAAEDIYQFWNDKNFPLDKVGFEVSGQQGVILTAIKEYIWNKYKVAIRFVELVHTGDSKAERIEAMAPEYEMGKILHSEQMAEPYGLEDQLLKFPKGKDDIADAAAMQKEVAKAPIKHEEAKRPMNIDELINEKIREKEKPGNRIERHHPILGDY